MYLRLVPFYQKKKNYKFTNEIARNKWLNFELEGIASEIPVLCNILINDQKKRNK